MKTSGWQVEFYETENSSTPVLDFILRASTQGKGEGTPPFGFIGGAIPMGHRPWEKARRPGLMGVAD